MLHTSPAVFFPQDKKTGVLFTAPNVLFQTLYSFATFLETDSAIATVVPSSPSVPFSNM
jgi:hypothetical protein